MAKLTFFSIDQISMLGKAKQAMKGKTTVVGQVQANILLIVLNSE